MAELVKIPFASSEYQARFERPYIPFIGHDRPRAFEAVFSALLPFDLRLENTEVLATGSLADHKTIFKLPERGIRIEFGAEEYKFTKEPANWPTAETDGQILVAAERALMEGSDANIVSCIVRVGMHLQLLAKPREEILAPFFPDPFKIFLTHRQAQTYGSHLRFADGDVLLDFSVAFANGIFLRFSSQFIGHPSLAEVLAKVRSDQDRLFGILGVEEATNA
jgi:hypothetical protein